MDISKREGLVALSKIDMVTATLREQISSGHFGPGEQLRQRDLAAAMNVSITPVREALRRLESEGVVSYDPHYGATVVEVDFGPTEENFRIRAALESLAASLAAERITDGELDELDQILGMMTGDVLTHPAELVKLNRRFHFLIFDAARSPLLNAMIRRLWQSFGGGPVAIRNVEESMSQHRLIVSALRARSPDMAQDATRLHILSGIQRYGLVPATGDGTPDFPPDGEIEADLSAASTE